MFIYLRQFSQLILINEERFIHLLQMTYLIFYQSIMIGTKFKQSEKKLIQINYLTVFHKHFNRSVFNSNQSQKKVLSQILNLIHQAIKNDFYISAIL